MMSVEDLFKSLSGKKVTVLLNEGNRGDGLIHAGGRYLLNKYGVFYTEILFPQMASGEVLLMYGCGNFCRQYHYGVSRLRRYLDYFQNIYILPASFDASCQEVREMLLGLSDKVFIFCREKYSFEQVRKLAPYREKIFLDHDLACHLDYSRWPQKGRGVLIAFRKDWETRCLLNGALLGLLYFAAKLFNSKIIRFEDVARGGNHEESEALLETISRYRVIYTDRAHVGIAAAMMGKITYLYPNAYHKVRGIYEYSLSHLPNVKFVTR